MIIKIKYEQKLKWHKLFKLGGSLSISTPIDYLTAMEVMHTICH